MRTIRNRFLDAMTAGDIDAHVTKILRGFGNPRSPIDRLTFVRCCNSIGSTRRPKSDSGAPIAALSQTPTIDSLADTPNVVSFSLGL